MIMALICNNDGIFELFEFVLSEVWMCNWMCTNVRLECVIQGKYIYIWRMCKSRQTSVDCTGKCWSSKWTVKNFHHCTKCDAWWSLKLLCLRNFTVSCRASYVRFRNKTHENVMKIQLHDEDWSTNESSWRFRKNAHSFRRTNLNREKENIFLPKDLLFQPTMRE